MFYFEHLQLGTGNLKRCQFIPVTPKPLTKKFSNFWSRIQFATFSRELEKVSMQDVLTKKVILLWQWRVGQVGLDSNNELPLPKLNNLFVSKSCSRFCAKDLQISFLAFGIASKKNSKIISETCANWLQFGTVCETWGLAIH